MTRRRCVYGCGKFVGADTDACGYHEGFIDQVILGIYSVAVIHQLVTNPEAPRMMGLFSEAVRQATDGLTQ
jgi:hypothetical protein